MGPACLEFDLEQRCVPMGLKRVVVGDALAARRPDHELVVVPRAANDRCVDGAAQRIEVALDHRVVRLVDGAATEGPLQPRVGDLGLRHDHQPLVPTSRRCTIALPFGHAGRRDAKARPPRGARERWDRSSRRSGGRRHRLACRRPRNRRRRERSEIPRRLSATISTGESGGGMRTSRSAPAMHPVGLGRRLPIERSRRRRRPARRPSSATGRTAARSPRRRARPSRPSGTCSDCRGARARRSIRRVPVEAGCRGRRARRTGRLRR